MQKKTASQALVVRGVPAQRVAVKKKNKNKKKNRNNASVGSLSNARAATFAVTHGGLDYIQCVLNARDGPMAHVPWGYPVRSRLIRVKQTGVFTSGANGCPFVAMCPWRMIASDEAAIFYTTGTFVSGSGTTLTSVLAGVNTAGSNSDYTIASITSKTFRYRLVGARLSASATSSLTARAGSLVAFTEPDHYTFLNVTPGTQGQKLDEIMAYEGCKVQATPMDNREIQCIWGTPETPEEAEFLSYFGLNTELSALSAFTGYTATVGAQILSDEPIFAHYYNVPMIIFSPDASSTSFRYEAYAVFEVSGQGVTGKSGGSVDPNAFSAVSGYLASTPGMKDRPSSVADVSKWAMEQTGVMDKKGNVQWATVGSYVGTAGKALAAML